MDLLKMIAQISPQLKGCQIVLLCDGEFDGLGL